MCFKLRKTCEYTTFLAVPLSVHLLNRLSGLPTLEHATYRTYNPLGQGGYTHRIIGHAARKLRYCVTWQQKWNNLNDEQRKYLHDVRNKCRNDIPFPKAEEGIPFPKAKVTFYGSGATGVTRINIFVVAVAARG